MGARQPRISTPDPSPEIQQQLASQQALSAKLAEQQAQFEKQYQEQLRQVQASYDNQFGLLTKQYEDQRTQYGLLTSQLQQQLEEQRKAREQQAMEYEKLLEAQNAQTELSNINASRERFTAQQTAANTTNNVARLLGNVSSSQRQLNSSSMLRGSNAGYGSGMGSLLRR